MESLDHKINDVLASFEHLKSQYKTLDLTLVKIKLEKISKIIDKLTSYLTIFRKYEECYKSEFKSSDIPAKLKELEKFMKDNKLDYVKPEVKTDQVEVKTINIGYHKNIKFYNNKSNIPLLEYGAIKKNDNIYILLHINKSNYITCDKYVISENNNNLISCVNGDKCLYGDSCIFYHDPQFTKTEHIANFQSIYLNKSCPNFGDYNKIAIQMKTMKFDNIRNLMRYCANVLLMGSLIE
jgi:hypothetical protein